MVGKLTRDDQMSASRIPALMGLSPYKTPNELLKEAIDAAAGNPPERFAQNEAMRFGDLLEPTILREAAYRLDLEDVVTDIDEAVQNEIGALEARILALRDPGGKEKRLKEASAHVVTEATRTYVPSKHVVNED